MISHPVGTLSGVPRSTGLFFAKAEEVEEGEDGELKEGTARDLNRFLKLKRRYAYALGVDVYSSNEKLQEALNSVTWAGYAGNMGEELLATPVSGPAGMEIKGAVFTEKMNKLLRDHSPEELEPIQQKKLQECWIDETVIERFLRHQKYSPRHKTILAHALAELKGVNNLEVFLEQALAVEYEDDAFLFQQRAEMLAVYHTQVKPISEIIPVASSAAAYTADQTLVALLPIDYAYWNGRADMGTDAFVQLKSENRPIHKSNWGLSEGAHHWQKRRLKQKESRCMNICEKDFYLRHPANKPLHRYNKNTVEGDHVNYCHMLGELCS
ncbi:MAG: hypothetical protein MRJ65_00015 [Candidatus Brocadiaceae bacterium]|nr:hypothetical protein [Candidatus Brocadiaceae bacterium]